MRKLGWKKTSIRVNRVGGPFGHAGGQRLSTIRKMVVSPYVTGALPRNKVSSVIVLPVDYPTRGVTTFAFPLYIAAPAHDKGIPENAAASATTAPHKALPRPGFSSHGRNVVKASSKSNIELAITRLFTSVPYSGARILVELAKQHPELSTSREAALRTYQNEAARHYLFEAGIPIRRNPADGLRPFHKNQLVWALIDSRCKSFSFVFYPSFVLSALLFSNISCFLLQIQ